MSDGQFSVGDKVRILIHSYDDDGEGNERHVHPGDVGEVTSVDYYERQGWTYGVVFKNGCWLFLSPNLDGQVLRRIYDGV